MGVKGIFPIPFRTPGPRTTGSGQIPFFERYLFFLALLPPGGGVLTAFPYRYRVATEFGLRHKSVCCAEEKGKSADAKDFPLSQTLSL